MLSVLQVVAPEPLLGLAWPAVGPGGSSEECVLATLESGSVMLATAPAELAAAGRTSGNSDMHLAGREGVSVRVVKVWLISSK